MQVIGEIIIFVGTIFLFLSAIGIGKMPDFLMKLQSASKASAFGIILILIGSFLIVQEWEFIVNSIIIFSFLIITTPIGAHALAQAHKRINSRK